jgi:hypothetical protein
MALCKSDQPASEPSPAIPDRDASATPLPASPTSRSRSSLLAPPADSGPIGDTLLSAPTPAERWETKLEDRLAVARQRIEVLEARVRALETRASPDSAKTRVPSGLWWVGFLLLLVLMAQIAAWLRAP